jgi:hypothetical protein
MRVCFAVALLFFLCDMNAQEYPASGIKKLVLKNTQEVQVVQNPVRDEPHTYYYLPTGLRLSSGKEGNPEFNFTSYESEGIPGAILHFLVVWGLEPKQERELEKLLRETVDSLAILRGAAMVSIPEEERMIKISGEAKFRGILENCVGGMPATAVLPGTKMAMAYRLKGEDAYRMQSALQRGEGLEDVFMELTFEHTVKTMSGRLIGSTQKLRHLLRVSLYEIFKPVME